MSSWDPYLDLESGVLRNRLGITDPHTLSQAEAAIATNAMAELTRSPLPGHYDLPHLRAFHRFIFGDIYEWAGELRTVTLGKTGQMFCPPHDIKRRAGQLFLGLAAAVPRKYLSGHLPAGIYSRPAGAGPFTAAFCVADGARSPASTTAGRAPTAAVCRADALDPPTSVRAD